MPRNYTVDSSPLAVEIEAAYNNLCLRVPIGEGHEILYERFAASIVAQVKAGQRVEPCEWDDYPSCAMTEANTGSSRAHVVLTQLNMRIKGEVLGKCNGLMKGDGEACTTRDAQVRSSRRLHMRLML
jgi:hypothetical protein